ncbi:unnamed protein product, partial [Protopolystoma xenopodis]
MLGVSKNVFILSGAGISAESGIPTFRGEGGIWRNYNAVDLATPEAFINDPVLVWEFYQYRRNVVLHKKPNEGHYALAAMEKAFNNAGRNFVIATQNVDGFHLQSGSKHVYELHGMLQNLLFLGNLFRVRCGKCGKVSSNKDNPICPAFLTRSSIPTKISVADLPHCNDLGKDGLCGGLLRPDIVWFGESLDPDIVCSVEKAISSADICLVIGTSAVVYPAAGFISTAAMRRIPL